MQSCETLPLEFPTDPRVDRMPRVWAIGGGKGGVGKSVIASNMAIALAKGGARCAVIDADLGGANAHMMLGVPRPKKTISHFLSGDVESLEEVLCPTTVPDVWLASGARALLEVANLKHSQKNRFLRHIGSLGVDHVVLDLGAGTAFNVLDFFLAAHRKLVIVSPEPTAIENTYHFLKAAFFRSLRHAARRSPVRVVLEKVLADAARRALTPNEWVNRAAEADADAGRILKAQVERFDPMLIVNQVTEPEHRQLGGEISGACRVHLGSKLRYLGALEHDERVPESVCRQLPVLQLYPGSTFATSLSGIVARLQNDDVDSGERAPAATPVAPQHYTTELVEETARRLHTAALERSSIMLPPLDTEHPGRYLQRCREDLGLPLSLLSERTRIRRLERIENERYDELPPEPYVRGYVVQYAKALGIPDADALATSYIARMRGAAKQRVVTTG